MKKVDFEETYLKCSVSEIVWILILASNRWKCNISICNQLYLKDEGFFYAFLSINQNSLHLPSNSFYCLILYIYNIYEYMYSYKVLCWRFGVKARDQKQVSCFIIGRVMGIWSCTIEKVDFEKNAFKVLKCSFS